MNSLGRWRWLINLKWSYLCSIILFSILYCLFPVGQVMAIPADEIDGKNPIKVELSIFIIDIDSIDTVEQNFTANLFFEARWHDPNLVHLGPHLIAKPLSEIWRPNLQVINQQHVWESFPEEVEITPEGLVTYRQRLWGDFSQKMNLKDFPFDRQTFTVHFVAAGYNPGQVELVSDKGRKTGISANISESDWEILQWHTEPGMYEPIPGHGGPPGYAFTFEAQRKQNYFLFKVIIPLVLIVMMSWVAFWIDPSEFGTDISVAVTSMLTLIAYRFAIGMFLPVISYLTRLDLFILGATILVFLCLVEVVITSVLVRRHRGELADTVDRYSRWVFPAIFVWLVIQTLYLPFPSWI